VAGKAGLAGKVGLAGRVGLAGKPALAGTGARPEGASVGYGSSTIAWTGTSAAVAATDSAGNLDYWWQAAGTAPWNPETIAVGGL